MMSVEEKVDSSKQRGSANLHEEGKLSEHKVNSNYLVFARPPSSDGV